jgi:hypothetical protein
VTYPPQLAISPLHKPLTGTAHVPGSKSITNRALALAALAEGTTTLTGALFADDTQRMQDGLQALGFRVEADAAAQTITVEGQGGQIPATEASLFVGNSGTTSRFISPLAAWSRNHELLNVSPDFYIDFSVQDAILPEDKAANLKIVNVILIRHRDRARNKTFYPIASFTIESSRL